jgi:glutathione S-transferase
MKLYHCRDARSLRPLWALEELGLACELVTLPFPPHTSWPGYLADNPLRAAPTLVDGDLTTTGSAGVCHHQAKQFRRRD